MIEPVLACTGPAMLALSLAATAASTAIAYRGQKQAAAAAKKYQSDIQEANNEQMLRTARSANIKASQEAEARAQKGEAIRLKAMGARADAQAAIAESGASGVSYSLAMNQFSVQESRLKHAMVKEQQNADASHTRYLDHLYHSTQMQNIASNRPVSQPSALGAVAGFVGQSAGTVYEFGKSEWGWGKSKPTPTGGSVYGPVNQPVTGDPFGVVRLS